MKRFTNPFVLATTLVLAVASTSFANHELLALQRSFDATNRQLHREREAALRQARAQFQATLERLRCAERDAHRLCEPEKSCALAKIRAERRRAPRAWDFP